MGSTFPDNIPVPDLLVKLCAFTEENGAGTFVGDLRLTDSGRGDALAWFDGDHEAADQFVIFAADRRLSLYGYWWHDHQALDAAPIVYLDSEATGNTVLTDTLDEFLELLTLGPKLADLGKGWPEIAEEAEATRRYRSWLRDEAGITTVADLAAFVQRAPTRTWRAFMLTSPSSVAGQCSLALAIVPDDRLDTARADVARARRIEQRFGLGKAYVACTATSRTASLPRC